MKNLSSVPKQKGRTLVFQPGDFEIVLPFGVGVNAATCFFELKKAHTEYIVFAKTKVDPSSGVQIYPSYSSTERMTLGSETAKVRFWVAVSDLDRLRARQLIEREHYLMPTARGLFLVCGIEGEGRQQNPKIIGVAVLDRLLHGNPKRGRSQFAKGNAWFDWPRNKIVNRLRVAWASRFAVHSSYHGCGIGTRLASHLKTVARHFRLPSADFIEVITTEPRPPKTGGKESRVKGNFLINAGYTRMEEPLRSSPLHRLNLETGYLESVSARKYYYYADIREE